MVPASVGMIPDIARSSVVLPAPFAPIRAVMLPAAIDRSMPRNTGTSPYPAQRPTTSSRAMMPPAEIGFYHRGVRGNRGRQPLGDLAAVGHHHDAIRQRHDRAHHMLDEQQRYSLTSDIRKDHHDLVDLGRSQAGHHFIEQQ